MTTEYTTRRQPTPKQLYKDLFVAVLMQPVFPDQKTFVDCIPKRKPGEILQQYYEQKDAKNFDLEKFVLDCFNLPEDKQSRFHSNRNLCVTAHINQLWRVLSRRPDKPEPYSSLLPLPYSYIVPGGRFREIYYWDSYFTMIGLQASGKKKRLEDMIKNFTFLIHRYGFVPNGNRSYYLTRSQPPFFSLMIDLVAGEKGNAVYATHLKAFLKEYRFWMRGSARLTPGTAFKDVVMLPDGRILNRYWDDGEGPREEAMRADIQPSIKSKQPPEIFFRNMRAAAESGWDFSSRWFKDGFNLASIRTTDVLPIDLNCLLYHLEKNIALGYEATGDRVRKAKFLEKADIRRKTILKYCWNEQQQCFCDYLFKENKPSDELTLAALFPLFFHIATAEQARSVQQLIKEKFLKRGGVVTTLKDTGQQWDSPNGWAPLEYVTIEGLKNYGFNTLAKEIARRWIRLNVKVFKKTGKLMEKYNVEDIGLPGGGGEYRLQDGFGWTNGVLLKLMQQYPDIARKYNGS